MQSMNTLFSSLAGEKIRADNIDEEPKKSTSSSPLSYKSGFSTRGRRASVRRASADDSLPSQKTHLQYQRRASTTAIASITPSTPGIGIGPTEQLTNTSINLRTMHLSVQKHYEGSTGKPQRRSSVSSMEAALPFWKNSEVVNSNVMKEARMVMEDDDFLRDFQRELKDSRAATGITGLATKARLKEFIAKRSVEDHTSACNGDKRKSLLRRKSALRELLKNVKDDESSDDDSSSKGHNWMEQMSKRAKEIKLIIKKQLDEEYEMSDEPEEKAQEKAERQRAAKVAIILAKLYADLGLAKRSAAVVDSALELWTLKRDSNYMHTCNKKDLIGGFTEEEVADLNESDLKSIIELKIEQSKVLATQASNENGSRDQVKCIVDALAVFQHFSSTVDASRYRTVKFPIYSILFLYVKTGNIHQEDRRYFMTQLSEDFVKDATLHGDPVHLSRALAMRAEVCANFGRLQEAICNTDALRQVYDTKYSKDICNAYGSDRSAQCFSMSALWRMEADDPEGSLETCEYVLTEILPNSPPKNVHNSMCLLYPIIVIFKNLGNTHVARAKTLFKIHVLEAFQEHFKDGGITPTMSMFKPTELLLSIIEDEEDFGWRSDLTAIFNWAASEDGGSVPDFIDSAMENFGMSPTTIMAELCLRLSNLGDTPNDLRVKLQSKSMLLALRVRQRLQGKCESVAHRFAFLENEQVCEVLEGESARSSSGSREKTGAAGYWLHRYIAYRQSAPSTATSSGQCSGTDPTRKKEEESSVVTMRQCRHLSVVTSAP